MRLEMHSLGPLYGKGLGEECPSADVGAVEAEVDSFLLRVLSFSATQPSAKSAGRSGRRDSLHGWIARGSGPDYRTCTCIWHGDPRRHSSTVGRGISADTY
jgi:hypothetical protein